MHEQQPGPSGASDPLLVLAVLAAAVTLVLTGITFWLSYEHLHDVAVAHGLGHDRRRAWVWPAAIDLYIILGEILILRASLARRGVALAVALTVAGAGGSIALNVAGVGAGASPMDYTVAAVPPVASLLAFGCLMWQIHGWLGRRAGAAPATATGPTVQVSTVEPVVPARPTAPPTPVAVALPAPVAVAATPAPVPAVAPAQAAPAPAQPTYADPRCAVIRSMYDAGARPSATRMVRALEAAGLNVSPSTAKNLRAKVENSEPRLLDLPAAI